MGFTKVLRSVVGIFSKDNKKSKKVTKSQKQKTTKTTKTKVRNLVSFFAGSRSNRHSTDSETLFGSSHPSSTRQLPVETNGSNIYDVAGPSFAAAVVPIAITIAAESDQTIVRDFALSSTPATPSVEVVVDNSFDNGREQPAEDVLVSEESTTTFNDNGDGTEVTDHTENLTVETLNIETPVTEHDLPVSNDNNVDETLPMLSTDLTIDIPDNFQLVITPVVTPDNEEEVVKVVAEVTEPMGENFTPPNSTPNSTPNSPVGNPQEIEVAIGLSAANIALPDSAPNSPTLHTLEFEFATQLSEAYENNDNDSESDLEEAEDLQLVWNDTPDPEDFERRFNSLPPSFRSLLSMWMVKISLIFKETLAGRLLVHRLLIQRMLLGGVRGNPIVIPERQASLPDAAPVIVRTNVDNEASDNVAAGPDPNNHLVISPGLVVERLFTDDVDHEAIFEMDDLETADTAEQDVAAEQEVKVDETNESVDEFQEILSTEFIPHRLDIRPILPPGLDIPWGSNNPIPIRLSDFRSTDPLLPTADTDPVGYSMLNKVQRRWVVLEGLWQVPIWHIIRDNLASDHIQEDPGHALYGFNNFCGYFNCKVTTCRHTRPTGKSWSFNIYDVVEEFQQRREEETRRIAEEEALLAAETAALMEHMKIVAAQVEEGIAQHAQRRAEDAALLAEAIARTTVQEAGPVVGAAEGVPSQVEQKDNFGLKKIDLAIPPKVSRFSKWFKSENAETSEDSKGPSDASENSGNLSSPTPETSLEGSQVAVQPVEPLQAEGVPDFSAYNADAEIYGASPPSPPHPESLATSSPVTTPEEPVEDSVEESIENTDGTPVHPVCSVEIEYVIRFVSPNEMILMGLYELPIESYSFVPAGESAELAPAPFDDEGWVFVEIIDPLVLNNKDEEIFDEDGWLVVNLDESPILKALRESIKDGVNIDFDFADDLASYINSYDIDEEREDESSSDSNDDEDDADDQGGNNPDSSDDDDSSADSSSDSDDDDDDNADGDEATDSGSSDEDDSSSDSSSDSSDDGNQDDVIPASLPTVGSFILGKRIPIPVISFESHLTKKFAKRQRQEARGIFKSFPPGPEDDPDVLVDRQLEHWNGESSELHISQVMRHEEKVVERIVKFWRRNPDRGEPNAPMRPYLVLPTDNRDEENWIELPRDVILAVNKEEARVRKEGIEAARKAEADEREAGALFVTGLEMITPNMRGHLPTRLGEMGAKLNISQMANVLEPWDVDPYFYDEMWSTF